MMVRWLLPPVQRGPIATLRQQWSASTATNTGTKIIGLRIPSGSLVAREIQTERVVSAVCPRSRGGEDMKELLIVAFVLTTSLAAVGQNGFEPVVPDEPVDFLQVNDSGAYVRGYWVAVEPSDERSKMTGPSTSEIICDRENKSCTDTTANIMVMGYTFALSGGQDEYTIERWNSKEILASNIGGTCRVRNVIKFDRFQKRVYFMQTLTEPVDDLPKGVRDLCKLTGMNLELKHSTLWRVR
jgi:hypothetical protein